MSQTAIEVLWFHIKEYAALPCTQSRKAVEKALDDYTAALATGEVSVKVKPLEWDEPRTTEDGRIAQDAQSPFSRYIASDTGWFLLGVTGYETERGLEASKAAAQADYEQRILSAIERHSADPVKAWQDMDRLPSDRSRIEVLDKLDRIETLYANPEARGHLKRNYIKWRPIATLAHPPVTAGWEKAAEFLLDRLEDFERGMLSEDTKTTYRDWCGHIQPPMARLRAALSTPPQSVTEVTMKVLDDEYAWYSSTNHGSLDGIPFEHVAHVIDVMRSRVAPPLRRV